MFRHQKPTQEELKRIKGSFKGKVFVKSRHSKKQFPPPHEFIIIILKDQLFAQHEVSNVMRLPLLSFPE